MPQLKKLSLPPNNILPKLDHTIGFGNANEGLYSSAYLTLLMEDEKSQNYTSEPESDVSDSVQNRPRKRQRLDHLSQEEKVMRRKLKNRVAAQTARDRKKAKMQELEEQVSRLVVEKRVLFVKSIENVKKIRALEQENAELKLRLGLTDIESNSQKVKMESNSNTDSFSVSDENRSLEHAEGTRSADSFILDDAIRLLTSNSETDDLLGLLQQCGEDLMGEEFLDTYVDTSETQQQDTLFTEVVGTSSKSLESNKELIHVDHMYSKQEGLLSVTDESRLCLSALQDSDLSTKDSCISQTILPDDHLDGIVEIVDNCSSTDIPIISISSNTSESPLEDMSFECDTFSFGNISEHLLSPPIQEPCSSPSSSDPGYDSSFSASSPCGDAGNPWDDTLTELFPSLV